MTIKALKYVRRKSKVYKNRRLYYVDLDTIQYSPEAFDPLYVHNSCLLLPAFDDT